MTTHCSILQVLIPLQDIVEVPNGGFGSCLKQPEGQVVVAAGQGPINGLNLDCRQELTTLGEPLVVVVEALQSLSAGELEADANSRPGPIEPFVLEALEDPKMHMELIGRSSKAVQRSNQDQGRVQLLRILKETILSQGVLHS